MVASPPVGPGSADLERLLMAVGRSDAVAFAALYDALAPRVLGLARRLLGDPSRAEEVTAWAGPWPADERWWDPAAHRRRARIQVVLADGCAHLLSLEAGSWSVEATYD